MNNLYLKLKLQIWLNVNNYAISARLLEPSLQGHDKHASIAILFYLSCMKLPWVSLSLSWTCILRRYYFTLSTLITWNNVICCTEVSTLLLIEKPPQIMGSIVFKQYVLLEPDRISFTLVVHFLGGVGSTMENYLARSYVFLYVKFQKKTLRRQKIIIY